MTILSDRVIPSEPTPSAPPAKKKRSLGAAIISWVTSTDHKTIGYLYLVTATIWFFVAGPLAQFRPRLPGWAGFPSNLRTSPVSLSTYASSPHADSQLKQIDGMIQYRRRSFFGQLLDS